VVDDLKIYKFGIFIEFRPSQVVAVVMEFGGQWPVLGLGLVIIDFPGQRGGIVRGKEKAYEIAAHVAQAPTVGYGADGWIIVIVGREVVPDREGQVIVSRRLLDSRLVVIIAGGRNGRLHQSIVLYTCSRKERRTDDDISLRLP